MIHPLSTASELALIFARTAPRCIVRAKVAGGLARWALFAFKAHGVAPLAWLGG
jgi:hypothetical protein